MAIFNSYMLNYQRVHSWDIQKDGPMVPSMGISMVVDLDTRPGNLLHTANELAFVVISTMNGI